MATGADTKPTPAKRTRKAAPKTVAAKSPTKTAAKPPAAKRTRKPAAQKTTAQKVTASVAAAEHSVVDAATGAAASIRATAEKAIESANVAETARAVRARVRESTTRKPAANSARRTPRKSAAGIGTGTVIGAAAAGLAAGIVANLGRKAAVQAPSVMAGDWFEALKADHKAALGLLDKLAQSKPGQPARRTLLLAQLKHALGKHAFTEENVIYPALRAWGDKADADALNHEQGYHKQFLYELDGMDKSAPEFAQKVADFRADLAAHVIEEEEKIFPKIHDGLSDEKNRALTAAANKEGFKLA